MSLVQLSTMNKLNIKFRSQVVKTLSCQVFKTSTGGFHDLSGQYTLVPYFLQLKTLFLTSSQSTSHSNKVHYLFFSSHAPQ